MKGELEPRAGALDYEKIIKDTALLCNHPGTAENLPTCDLVLLGLGNDGHTASLFPGSEALDEKERLVCAVPAPAAEPAVPRLTLTLPVLNNARNVWFIAAGSHKGAIAEAIWSQNNSQGYPAAQIRPHKNLRWFVTL
jgi:6-phosphogluconolactonase